LVKKLLFGRPACSSLARVPLIALIPALLGLAAPSGGTGARAGPWSRATSPNPSEKLWSEKLRSWWRVLTALPGRGEALEWNCSAPCWKFSQSCASC